jgi:disulfide bond formation protein DsbB
LKYWGHIRPNNLCIYQRKPLFYAVYSVFPLAS